MGGSGRRRMIRSNVIRLTGATDTGDGHGGSRVPQVAADPKTRTAEDQETVQQRKARSTAALADPTDHPIRTIDETYELSTDCRC
jgi:hypothetical protein